MRIKRFDEHSINEESLSEIKKDWESIQKKVLSDLNLNFHMTAVFGFGIGFFYPVVDTLMRNGVDKIKVTDDMVVMITLCVFAIMFKEKKEEIKKLIEELRLRGIFGVMKNVFNSIVSIKELIFKVFESCGKTVNQLSDIFNYTMIFVPCLTMLCQVVKDKAINLSTFNQEYATIGLGILSITAKHILTTFIHKLKEKIRSVNDSKFLSFFKVKDDNVKTFNQFKEEDKVNDGEVNTETLDEIQYPEDEFEFEDEFEDDYGDDEDENPLRKFSRE